MYAKDALGKILPGAERNAACAEVARVLAAGGYAMYAKDALGFLTRGTTLPGDRITAAIVELAKRGYAMYAKDALGNIPPGAERNVACAEVARVLAAGGHAMYAKDALALASRA